MILDIVISQHIDQVNGSVQGKTALDYVIAISPAVVALVALYLSIMAYRNSDAKKVFVKDQVKLVLDMLKDIESTLLTFKTSEGPHNFTVSGFNISTIKFILKNLKKEHAPIFGKPMYVAGNFWQVKMFSYTGNIFLPGKIRKKIQRFLLSSSTPFQSKRLDEIQVDTNYVILFANDVEETANQPVVISQYHKIQNPIYKDSDSFFISLLDLKKTILDWCNGFGIDPNIDDNIL